MLLFIHAKLAIIRIFLIADDFAEFIITFCFEQKKEENKHNQ